MFTGFTLDKTVWKMFNVLRILDDIDRSERQFRIYIIPGISTFIGY